MVLEVEDISGYYSVVKLNVVKKRFFWIVNFFVVLVSYRGIVVFSG